jgi:hypothetical protein
VNVGAARANKGDEMTDHPGRRWPTGYRLILWGAGSLLVVAVLVAALFLANAPR